MSSATESIQPLIILALVLINLIGLVWAVIRERHLISLSAESTHSLRDMERTFQQGADAFKNNFRGIGHALKDLERQIEHTDGLTETRRQELIRLASEAERRVMHAIRDFAHQMNLLKLVGGGTNVNFNSGANGTQIGDGNKQ